MTTLFTMATKQTTDNPFSEQNKGINLFCDILDHYKNANEDTKFFVLFHRREFSIKIKFKVLSDVLVNLFVSPKVKNVLLDLFCKSQRIYYALSKFAHKYQFRKAKVRVNTDLCLNIIDPQYRKTIPIFDKTSRSVFLFTCADLVSIIMTALTHTSNFFIEPRVCKNPYTNIPFQKSNLYSIYFHIQDNYPVIPPLLYSFFMCNFDLNLFFLQNEHVIRCTAVKNYLKNSSTRTLYLEVFHMLHLMHSNLCIDENFPEQLLVDIMRPYLYLYLMFMYSILGSEQRGIYYIIMKKKIGDFIHFNGQFGRKRIDCDKQVKYNCNYPNFTIKDVYRIIETKEYMQWYCYSNTWDIPSPYTSQLRRLNGYSQSLYRTDVDYDDDEPYESVEEEESIPNDTNEIDIPSNTDDAGIRNDTAILSDTPIPSDPGILTDCYEDNEEYSSEEENKEESDVETEEYH